MKDFFIRAQADNLQDAQRELGLMDTSIITIVDSEDVYYGTFADILTEELDRYHSDLQRSQLSGIKEALSLFKKRHSDADAVVIVPHTALSITSFLLYCEGSEEVKEELTKVYLKPYIDWFYQNLK